MRAQNKPKKSIKWGENETFKGGLIMFIYKDAVGFVGNVGVWSDGMGGYILVDLCTSNKLYIH